MTARAAIFTPFPLTLLEDPQAGDIGDQPVSTVGPGFVGELRVECRPTKNRCSGLDPDDRPATRADEGRRLILCFGQGMNRARRVVPRSVHDRYVRTRMRIPRATPQQSARCPVGLHWTKPFPGDPAQVEELLRPTPGASFTEPGGAADGSSPAHLTTQSVGEVVG